MKRLKDPIYGYIEIDDAIAESIIDTPVFQRLRFIIQTSYSPLYASAVHNRFVHSLGVYYLGKLVSEAFKQSLSSIRLNGKKNLDSYIEVFQYACLLHDVGHAPFSHTGEEFYLGPEASREQLHNEIVQLTGDTRLKKEIKKNNYGAAPHELMSIVVALKNFALFKNNKEKSFFARCISGYLYTENASPMETFLNCMISMLNSSVIDVDKLDYLIRDAYITGFDTVSIDYVRLLRSVRVFVEDDRCRLVFTKAAISVIENAVFAHDAEKKWIQNHPVVLYEAYLVRHALETLNNKYHVFDYEALTVGGKELSNNFRVSLLSDGDILFLMKNLKGDPLIDEYFSRKDRRHPLWKSEAEYKAIFTPGFSDANFKAVEERFEELEKYLNLLNGSSQMNDAAINAVRADIAKTKEQIVPKSYAEQKYRKQLATKERYLKLLECLRDYAHNQGMDFDFVIVGANQFNSGFGKLAFEKIEIMFPALGEPRNFKKVTNALSSQKSSQDKFYYLFARRMADKKQADVRELAMQLGKLAMEEAFAKGQTD